jgi:cytochrome P450
MGSCARHLAEQPTLQDELRQKPERIAAAVDELLRLYTPNQGFCRTATREVTLHGRQIAPRAPIVLAYPSANRDPTRFDDPDSFQLDRPQKHVAFGHGIHKCPGEQLARLELRVFLEELLGRTTEIALVGQATPARWPEYGPRTLPLRLVGRA